MSDARDGRELAAPVEAHRLDGVALAKYLGANVAGFAGNCVVRQFLGGQSNPTYLIEAQSGNYVLRKQPPGTLLPSAHAVDREFAVMSALANSSVPVPHMHILCEDESVIGQMFYVMDYVPGRVIADPVLPDCSAAERSAMYQSLVKVLGTLHAVDYQAAGLEDYGRPSAYIARQVARWSKQYAASKIDDCIAMDRLIDWLPANNPDDELSSIVHGDYRPGNVIFDSAEPRVVSVLDWELSTIGHPFADLGYFLMPYRLDADAAINGFRGRDIVALGIPGEQDLLEIYAKTAGRKEVPNIDYYIAFSMFRLAAILAGVLRRGLQGSAADPRAIERGEAFRQIADSGWKIAREIRG